MDRVSGDEGTLIIKPSKSAPYFNAAFASLMFVFPQILTFVDLDVSSFIFFGMFSERIIVVPTNTDWTFFGNKAMSKDDSMPDSATRILLFGILFDNLKAVLLSISRVFRFRLFMPIIFAFDFTALFRAAFSCASTITPIPKLCTIAMN